MDNVLIPKLLSPSLDLTKGDAGRICVFGGSRDYTGAPFFSAMGALKLGANLAYILCTRSSSIPIKSYSAELIVYPIVPDSDAPTQSDLSDFERFLEDLLSRVHVFVIGPGMGRDPLTIEACKLALQLVYKKSIPTIIDGDAIIHIEPSYVSNQTILTPNAREFERLCAKFKLDVASSEALSRLSILLKDASILRKGTFDSYACNGRVKIFDEFCGSPIRCGGQGDILTGILAALWHSNARYKAASEEFPIIYIAEVASRILRQAALVAFRRIGISVSSPKILEQISLLYSL